MSSPDKGQLQLGDQLCFAVYAASRAITSVYRPLLDRLGLTYPQYLAMLVLWETDKLTVKDIGARLYLDSGTLTPMIKRMAMAGLIRRYRDSKDERCVRVALTPAGRALRARAMGVPGALACKTGLSYDQAMSLRRQLARMTEVLCVPEAGAA